MRSTRTALTLCLVCLLAPFFANVFAQKRQAQSGGSATAEAPPPGWQRREVGDRDGRVSVLLPRQPEDLGVATLRRTDGPALVGHVYMATGEAQLYIILIVDLPRKAEDMTEDERANLFEGGWRAVATRAGHVLEKKFDRPFGVTTEGGQDVGGGKDYEHRAQDFKLGDRMCRAETVFVGRRAYTLVAVWDGGQESESGALRFLNSSRIHSKK